MKSITERIEEILQNNSVVLVSTAGKHINEPPEKIMELKMAELSSDVPDKDKISFWSFGGTDVKNILPKYLSKISGEVCLFLDFGEYNDPGEDKESQTARFFQEIDWENKSVNPHKQNIPLNVETTYPSGKNSYLAFLVEKYENYLTQSVSVDVLKKLLEKHGFAFHKSLNQSPQIYIKTDVLNDLSEIKSEFKTDYSLALPKSGSVGAVATLCKPYIVQISGNRNDIDHPAET